MHENSGDLPEPGWYPDGPDTLQLRWWSGIGWTEHVSNPSLALAPTPQPVIEPTPQAVAAFVSQVVADPVPPAAADPADFWAAPVESDREGFQQDAVASHEQQNQGERRVHAHAQTEPQHGGVATLERRQHSEQFPASAPREVDNTPTVMHADQRYESNADLLRAAAGYKPPVEQPVDFRISTAEFIHSSRRRTSHTVSSWLLALAPAGIAAGLVQLLPKVPAFYFTSALVIGTLVALLALILLASLDGRGLSRRGYEPPFAGLTIFPPLYFALRTLRVGWAGIGQLLLSVVVVAGLTFVFVGPMLGWSFALNAQPAHAVPLTQEKRLAGLTTGLEPTVAGAVAKLGVIIGVPACQPFPSIVDAASTSCSVDIDGKPWIVQLQSTPKDSFVPFIVTSSAPA